HVERDFADRLELAVALLERSDAHHGCACIATGAARRRLSALRGDCRPHRVALLDTMGGSDTHAAETARRRARPDGGDTESGPFRRDHTIILITGTLQDDFP